MNNMSKKLMSIATTVAVSVSVLSSFASVNAAIVDKETVSQKSTPAETQGIYSTNGKGFGKKKTISIDGDFSDWSEDMLIAQGAACDTATRFKGVWENWVMDSYSLYGAWDDENLYVAWQNVNTYDTFWPQDGNGPLSDRGKCGDAPVLIAIDTGKGNAMTGRMQDGKGIWGIDVEFETRVDNILAIHSNLTGTPGLFKADSSGASSYAAADGLLFDFKKEGIEVALVDDCFPSEIMGVWDPGDENDKASYDLNSNWVDLKTTTLGVRKHDTKYDTFYEMKIPFSALGITKEDVESNGVGVMQIISRGESGMDCVPHDPSMLDNTYGDYGHEPSNSHEKDDKDIITVPLAKIGKGGTTPPVSQGTVKVKYVDEAGNEIASSKTMTGNVGDSYTTSAVSVSGYTLKTTPSNASGTYKNGTITVTYVYSEDNDDVEKGTVIVKYVDEKGNEIASSTTKTGEVGTSYTTTAKTISDYTLKTTPSNASGTYKNGTITVTYVYSKDSDVSEGTVNVKYVDEKGDEIVSSTTKTGEVGTSYTTTAKTIPGYTLKTTPSNASGTYKNGTITVTYVYSKNSDVSKGTVVVNYLDESENEIAPSETKTGKIGTSYTTTAKVISGYTLVSTPVNASGTYKDGKRIVTYYYRRTAQTELNITSFKTDVLSPQDVGTEVILSALAKGEGQLKYRFRVKDKDGNITTIRDYSISNAAIWKANKVGNNTLYVDVKDGNGNVKTKSISYTIKSNLAISSFTANKTSPQAVKTAVTFRTKVSGTTGTVQYKYYRYLNGKYATIKDWSNNSSITIAPSAAGKYDVYVAVKDGSGKTVRKNIAFEFKNQANLAISSFTANKTSPQAVKTAVTFTTKVSGTTGTVQYKYYRYLNGNYATIKDWSNSSSITIAPSTVGKYDVYVAVKDGSGKTVRKNITFAFK